MNGKKVLITGAGGVVGDCLVKNFLNSVGYLSSNLDVTNALQVHRVLSIEKPDIIIHTAAFTNVEACEVEIDKAFLRPTDIDDLVGDPLKAKKELGWKPKVNFKQLVKMMVEHDIDYFRHYADPFEMKN